MPTDRPSNTTDAAQPAMRDDATAAAVLNDDALDQTPGGGGLGGKAAADTAADATRPDTASSRNAPIDTGVDSGDAAAQTEAARQAARPDSAAEPHPSSQ